MGRRLTGRAAAAGAVAIAAAAFGVGIAVGGSDGSGGNPDGGNDRAAETAPPPTAPPASLVAGRAMEEVTPEDPEKGSRRGSPLDDLPDGTRALTDVGQRPDWSPDGTEIVFLWTTRRSATCGPWTSPPVRPATSPRTSTTMASPAPTT